MEGQTAPQGESMGGREHSLLKKTDNLHTLSVVEIEWALLLVWSPVVDNIEPCWCHVGFMAVLSLSAAEQRAFTTGLHQMNKIRDNTASSN